MASKTPTGSKPPPPDAGAADAAGGGAKPPAATSCADHLRRAVLQGDLSARLGLPGGCTLDDTDAAFGAKHRDGAGRRGAWREYTVAEQERPVRVWFTRDRSVHMVDVGYPRLAKGAKALLAELGAPSEKLTAHMAWPESVYLELGLTVAVSDGKVAHLFLYEPTTKKDYLDRLGGQDDWVKRR